MSDYYNPRRNRNLFDPKSTEPFKVSRSKIDLFMNCPLCFYLDCRLGVGRPPGFPFALNSAVDLLLKKEFDIHRATKRAHPLMGAYGLKDFIPYSHEDLDLWRSNFKGIRFVYKPANLLVTGAIDDAWVTKALTDIRVCLMAEKPPKPAPDCDHCSYRKSARDVQRPVQRP